MSADEFLKRGAELLGVPMDALQSRSRKPKIVTTREMLATLGVERYGLRVTEIAMSLGKHRITATTWVMRGVRRRCTEPEFAESLEKLDAALGE